MREPRSGEQESRSGEKERLLVTLGLNLNEILGSAGLKDATKGVRSVFADFCYCGGRVKLRDVEVSERDSHLFVARCGYNHVW